MTSSRTADGTHYLILEYVPGGTLADRIAQGPLPLADALRLTADAARGLQAAHEVGHRPSRYQAREHLPRRRRPGAGRRLRHRAD